MKLTFSAGNSKLTVQSGIGLLEIMITVLLLSIGFLTAARMQVASMRFSQSAYYQSQASFMASDMIDRMRANVRGVQAGDYDDMTTSASAINKGCKLNACSPSDIAKQDLFEWSAALYPLQASDNFVPALPSLTNIPAVAKVTRSAPGRYSVTLSWGEIVDGQPTSVPMRFDFVTQF